MQKLSVLLSYSWLLMTIALQSTHAGEFHPVAFIAYDDGGDVMIETEMVTINSRPVSIKSQTKAGGGVTVAIGAYIPVSDMFGVQGSFGNKTDSISYSNGYVGFTRTPIDLLAYMHLDQHHSLAVGGTYHTNGKFTLESTDNPGSSFTADFDNATGAIAEYNYALLKSDEGGVKFGLRYTHIQYDLSDGSQSFDGSSFGIIIYAY